jgi:hypothetical protein
MRLRFRDEEEQDRNDDQGADRSARRRYVEGVFFGFAHRRFSHAIQLGSENSTFSDFLKEFG